MSATAYILLLTLSLTEGGTLEAEQETDARTLEECQSRAQAQQAQLRREFALSLEDRGMCPFRDVKIRCEKMRQSR